jgi:hypothetical protein
MKILRVISIFVNMTEGFAGDFCALLGPASSVV